MKHGGEILGSVFLWLEGMADKGKGRGRDDEQLEDSEGASHSSDTGNTREMLERL